MSFPINYYQQDIDTYGVKDRRPFVFPTESSIVDRVSKIVNSVANELASGTGELATTENTNLDAFGGVLNEANEAIYGGEQNTKTDKIMGITEYFTKEIEDFSTTEETDYTPNIDFINTDRTYIIHGSGIHDEHSENLPFIILVAVLAVLIIMTIIALIVYHHRKKRNSKDLTGITVIGKTFNPASLEEREEREIKKAQSKGKK